MAYQYYSIASSSSDEIISCRL